MGKILRLWPVFVAVLTLVYAVGATTTTIKKMEKKQDENCQLDDAQEIRITRNEQMNKELEKRLDRIEDKIDRIYRAVK